MIYKLKFSLDNLHNDKKLINRVKMLKLLIQKYF